MKNVLDRALRRLNRLHVMLSHDLLLFWRDRKSLILVLLTPFLILSILINIYGFSDVASTIKGVKVGVCSEESADFNISSDMFEVSAFEGECDWVVADKVRRGELRGAITIPKDFERNIQSGKGAVIALYLDNAKSTTAIVVRDAIKAYVSDLNEKIGREFILNAWENLNKLNDNLKILVKNLDAAYPVAVELQGELRSTERSLAETNISDIEQTLEDTIVLLDSLDMALSLTEQSVDIIGANIDSQGVSSPDISADEALREFEVYLSESQEFKETYCVDDVSQSLNVSLIKIPLKVYPNMTSGSSNDSFSGAAADACALVAQSDAAMRDMYDKLKSADDAQDNLTAAANGLIASSGDLRETVASLRKIVNSSGEQSVEAHENLRRAKEELVALDSQLGDLIVQIMSLERNIDDYLNQTITITEELRKTTIILDQYTARDPATILRPITVDTKAAFGEKSEIFSKIPALMGIVLLFVTLLISSSLIVNERKAGTMARVFLSPITMFLFIFEKALYLLALCSLEFISMLVAIFVFKVDVTYTFDFFVIMLVAAVLYLMMGILIGAISKSENTALLTCLVIAFPLMFLSGAFSPIELMTGIYRSLSPYLPLTIHIDALEKVMIYGTGLDMGAIYLMCGMILVCYLASVLIIRKYPTLR
jgi:ABC-type multidrug transport system permease subunit